MKKKKKKKNLLITIWYNLNRKFCKTYKIWNLKKKKKKKTEKKKKKKDSFEGNWKIL